MPDKGLEDVVNQEHGELKNTLRHFDVAHILGTIGSYAGSAGLAYVANKMTGRPYLSAALGSSIGDYVGYEAGFTPYWYWKNSDRYKGLGGKWKFAKDWTSFTVKSIPVEIGAYAANVPAALLGTALMGGNPVLGTLVGGVAVDLLSWAGLRYLNKGKLREVAEERLKYNGKPAYAH
ncbi:MAG TPA: hypothetical protein VJI52_01165 [Candidatus Nanoarchaeia archaeon]|nr:hypothetical protein [Candidatus Nanoarchaeia archaeon]